MRVCVCVCDNCVYSECWEHISLTLSVTSHCGPCASAVLPEDGTVPRSRPEIILWLRTGGRASALDILLLYPWGWGKSYGVGEARAGVGFPREGW